MARNFLPRAYNGAFSLKVIHEVPPYIALPAKGYGGTERVADGLVRGLADMGVDVTIRCSGDSYTDPNDRKKFKVVANAKKAHGMHSPFASKNDIDASLWDLFDQVATMPENLRPLVHAHTEDAHYAVADHFKLVVVTTLHNLPKPWVQKNFSHMPMVAISHAQAASPELQKFKFVETVYNGVNPNLYEFNANVDNDAPLVFLGRICEEKGVHIAIDVALRSKNRLVLAGPVEDEEFFKQKIEPIITQNNNLISYVGSVSDKAEDGQIRSSKCELLRNAKALMFPSCWAEPFGMVMPEAMACGTPVIGLDFKGSSVNEIVRNGINGFKFTREWEAAEIINTKLSAIDRHKVYNDFHSRFTTERMAQGYLRVYQEIRKHYMPEQVRARVTSRVGGFGLHVN